ncbi:hypothetical protein JXL21_01960 [Candidatus Bathyarchaeota archaeon]|nr:hypothetical protein [Candidatus Bathyarchaeota archaeon]
MRVQPAPVRNIEHYPVWKPLLIATLIVLSASHARAGYSPELTVDAVSIPFHSSDYYSEGVLFANQGWEHGNGTIWRSMDDGDTWRCIWGFPHDPPKNGRVCFVDSRDYIHVCGDNGTLWRSTDDGLSFNQTFDAILNYTGEMWNMDEDGVGNLYVATHGELPWVFKSVDAGASWVNVTGDWGTGHDINGLAVNPWTGWVYVTRGRSDQGGNVGIWRTMDGGETWAHISHNATYRLALACYDANRVYVSNENSPDIGLIGRFTDTGTETVEVETVHLFLGEYAFRPATWGMAVQFGGSSSPREVWYGTASTNPFTMDAYSCVVRSLDGEHWEIVLQEPSVAPRSQYYYTTRHPERARDTGEAYVSYLFPSDPVANDRIRVSVPKNPSEAAEGPIHRRQPLDARLRYVLTFLIVVVFLLMAVAVVKRRT